jgi:putative tryptophan/tyrosine transport system substrate-binding protein
MDRRAFLAGAAALLPVPRAAEAQQLPKLPRIGVLQANPGGFDNTLHDGLRQLGYVEGKSIAIEWRWAHARAERFPELAAELVRLKVEAIVATNNPAVAAAQKATTTIPIIMVLATDPVRLGFVTSLARPSGNITGLTMQTPELAGKRLQLLKAAVPHLMRVAVLWDSTEPGRRQLVKEAEVAAPTLGLQIQTLEARNSQDVGSAFTAMTRERGRSPRLWELDALCPASRDREACDKEPFADNVLGGGVDGRWLRHVLRAKSERYVPASLVLR